MGKCALPPSAPATRILQPQGRREGVRETPPVGADVLYEELLLGSVGLDAIHDADTEADWKKKDWKGSNDWGGWNEGKWK